MKISKLYLTASAITAIFLAACGGASHEATEETTDQMTEETVEVTEVNVNSDQSKVVWRGDMLNLYYHEGTINLSSASLMMSGDKITGGNFVIDMSTITPTDENYNVANDNTPEKLVGHLSSPDFFDVQNHPTASFEITGSGEGTVTGNLTIRGITNEETIEDVTFDSTTNSFSGKLIFDRKKYDVKFDMPVADKVLSDDIELSFNISI